MGHVPGGFQPRRDFFYLFEVSIPLYCKITALIYCIYLNIMVSYSVAVLEMSRGAELSRKRGNGEGSITKRKDGRWMARYIVHTSKGPKRKTVYGRTRQEVADELAKVLSDRIEGIVYDDENMTVGEYLDRWLKNSVCGSVRQSTYDRDANLVKNHLR